MGSRSGRMRVQEWRAWSGVSRGWWGKGPGVVESGLGDLGWGFRNRRGGILRVEMGNFGCWGWGIFRWWVRSLGNESTGVVGV